MLSDGELDKLAADIKENGQRHPIIIYSGWKILDGRNRLEACRRAGVEPVFHDVINEFESGDDDEIVRYVISTNLHRRHLDATQRAVVADKLATLRHGDVATQRDAQVCASSPACETFCVELSVVTASFCDV
jgi:ParB-like chromosome segregation protein Spo0J